jgi:inner membrane protein involved in colicin E2 resistance
VILRILSIIAIFICTTVAWMILGGTISSRTHSTDERLSSRVQSVWGTPQLQLAPSCAMETMADQTEEVQEKGTTRKVTKKVVVDTPVPADSSKLDIGLHLDHRKKGLLWYSTYSVAFAGDYVFRNPDSAPRPLRFVFPLPAEQAIYDGLEVSLNGRPQPLDMKGNAIALRVNAAPGEPIRLNIKYKSQGLESWRYSFGDKVNEVRNFALKMTTNFRDIDFPDNTLAPSVKQQSPDGWVLDWKYQSLLSGYQIAMAMPQKLQPGPLAAEISYFAPVSLFFFFFLMFLVTTLRRIDLHPMNYFFLAAAFFAFHLLLAYLVDHVDIHAAFLTASAVSIALVASYLRLVTGARFAFREAALGQFVYLVLFSYAFFFRGFTGLAITIGAIATLFVAMQATGRIRWSEMFSASGSIIRSEGQGSESSIHQETQRSRQASPPPPHPLG